jgi:hypothetical protein
MLRRTSVVLAAAMVAMALPSGVAAGGMSSFDFERTYYVPGERAVGQTGFWISRNDTRLLDRTFYAYLFPDSEWIEPPRIPSNAVPLGPVSLGENARISFTVPDVAPGDYAVGICDQPCRHAYVGDLGGGWISVVGSAEEARLRLIIDRLESRLWKVQSNLGDRLHAGKQRTATLQSQIDDLTDQLDRQRTSLEAALAGLARKPATQADPFDRAGWVVAILALAVLAFVASRRRRPSIPAAPEAPEARLVPTADDFGWQIESAEQEEEDERTPVGVR